MMELVFLGTGSGYPHLTRGASSVLLKQESGHYWMFDCGECTQLQIRRVPVKTGRLTKVFISHLHGDHVFGLPGFIDTYQGNFYDSDKNRVVEIYGPQGLRKYLRTCLELSRSELQTFYVVHELIPVTEQYPAGWQDWTVDHQAAAPCHPQEVSGRDIEADEHGVWHLFEDDQFIVKASYLKHRVPSFGFAVQEKPRPGKLNLELLKCRGVQPGPLYAKLKQGQSIQSPSGDTITPAEALGADIPGRKVVILGDTCDSSSMAQISHNATVLVHETTLENELQASCIEKGHSTPEMTGEFARKVEAEKLIITHFSHRYKSQGKECKKHETAVDKLLAQAREAFQSPEVIAAEDLLVVPL